MENQGKIEALRLYSGGCSCSSAVLQAFSAEAGLERSAAERIAGPMSGGKLVKCGAVLGAEEVLKRRFGGDRGSAMCEELEERFIGMNQSVICREIRGLGTGQRLRSCRGCVEDASEILEKMLMD